MAEKLNELSNNVLITLQSGKKVTDAVIGLRELYLYLFKHGVPLPSTTYNYLLAAIQDRENSRLGNVKICQLVVLVLFQSKRPIKQLQKGYTRVGDLLRSGISITRECLYHLISDIDIQLLFAQPSIWASVLHHVMNYSNRLLTNDELSSINLNLYNFISCNPGLVKRSYFSRAQKFYGPNRTPLTSHLTVLCTASGGKASPLLLLQAISFSYLRRWLQFVPLAPLEVSQKNYQYDMVSEYNDVVSRAGGASTIAQSTVSRITDATFSGLYNDNFYNIQSGVNASTYNPRVLTISITGKTGSALQDAALHHVTTVVEHCTKLPITSKDKVVSLAAYLECIQILDTVYETCQSVEVQNEILAAVSLILINLKDDKSKCILLPAAITLMMKHSPEMKLNPEDNEYLKFLYSDVIASGYETSTLMYEIVVFTLRFAPRIPRLLQSYFPNIFKIIAHRPTTFAREISTVLPFLYHSTVLVELFYSIVQIPILSALMMSKAEKSPASDWLQRVCVNRSSQPDISKIYHELDFADPKVVTCSQLAAVLLKLFLNQVAEHGDTFLFWECFMCLYKLPDIPGYQKAVSDVILHHLKIMCLKFTKRIMKENHDKILDFLKRVEQYKDHEMSTRLVNILIPPLCRIEATNDLHGRLYQSIEQQLYIVSAMSHIPLLNSMVLLLVVLSAKEPTRNDKTLTCIQSIKTKVCLRSDSTESQSLCQLVTTLSSILQTGGGSLVEIYKCSESPSHEENMNMLSALRLIDRVATI